jgi:hypothetical protein
LIDHPVGRALNASVLQTHPPPVPKSLTDGSSALAFPSSIAEDAYREFTMQTRRTSMLDTLLIRLGMKQPPVPTRVRGQPFQAISVHHGVVCCTAAKQAGGVRLLARHAPPLPLAGCSMRGACKCQYIKFGDRRGESRRMGDFGIKQPLFAAKEQRFKRGRRARD